jgi:hypothetical protein
LRHSKRSYLYHQQFNPTAHKMKSFIKFFLSILIALVSSYSFAQTSDLLDKIPSGKEEFIASEKKVINTINWLENTPLDQEVNKRKIQNAYLVAWLTNSPTVTIEVNSRILTFTKKNSELLVTFMGGWTKYCLENNYSTDLVKCNTAGIQSAIKVYKKGIAIKKDKAMEKLIELDDKGALEKWVAEQLAQK